MQTHLERIKKDLEVLATYTSTPGFGVTRSSYSKEDKQAREYLIREMEKLNLKIYEDGISTLFGRKEGTMAEAPVIMIGSHYDSVVNGGAFDGPVGCIAALEVLRVLEENHFINDYPIELILMNAEEGGNVWSRVRSYKFKGDVRNIDNGRVNNEKEPFWTNKTGSYERIWISSKFRICKKKTRFY